MKRTTLLLSALLMLALGTQAQNGPLRFHQGFALEHSGVQGMDIWGDTLVSLQNHGICQVYTLNGKTSAKRIATFNLASYNATSEQNNHSNCASFSGQYYDPADELPLLYVTRCNFNRMPNGMRNVCFVERLDVKNKRSTLVQTISYDEGNLTGDWVIDLEEQCLYTWATTKGTSSADNKCFLRKFRIPPVGPGCQKEVKLTSSDVLESYYFEDTYSAGMNDVWQGSAIRNGLLYLPCGFDTPSEPSTLYVWDLKKRRMDKVLHLGETFKGEFEDCSVNYPGWLVLQCNSKYIYFMSLMDKAGDWADYLTWEGLTYRITDHQKRLCEVVAYNRSNARVVIPSAVMEAERRYTVVGIAQDAFKGNRVMGQLTLPSTLRYIAPGALDDCANLNTLNSKIADPTQCSMDGLPSNLRRQVALCVPTGLLQAYTQATDWQGFRSITANSLVLHVGFNARGIVLRKGGTTNTVGKLGKALVSGNADRSSYVGSSRLDVRPDNKDASNGKSVFYVKYDKDDNVGLALRDQFTIEALVRLDKVAGSEPDAKGLWQPAVAAKVIGSQQGGGFSLMYNLQSTDALGAGTRTLSGFGTQYVYRNMHPTAPWPTPLGVYNHLNSSATLHPGRFYHVAVAIDRAAHTETIYVNGKKVKSGTLGGCNYFQYPDCGTARREKGMFFILGGDAKGEDTPSLVDMASAATFSFFKVHNYAFPADGIAQLYDTPEVKAFTEPLTPELLFDAQFAAGGVCADRSPLHTLNRPSQAKIVTQLVPDQQRYAMQCDGHLANFLSRPYQADAAFTSGMTDGYSIEWYALATPANRTQPMSALSGEALGFGAGLALQPDGSITFNSNAYGNAGPDGYKYSAQKANFTTKPLFPDGEWVHCVAVFEPNPDYLRRNNVRAQVYVNGKLASSRTLNGSEVTNLPHPELQWFALGGNTNSSSTLTCSQPWQGQIAIARIWSKPLISSDVTVLHQQATTSSFSITTSPVGLATVCLPFAARLPQGLTAYVAVDETPTDVVLQPLAQAGEALAYGTPVVLCGQPGTTYTLTAVTDDDISVRTPALNLLQGCFSRTTIRSGAAFALRAADTEEKVVSTSTVVVQPCQAYLPRIDAQGPTTKTLCRTDATAITAPQATPHTQATPWYDLGGKPTSRPQRGIHIQQGRKVLNR